MKRSIGPIDGMLTCSTTSGMSGPGSDGNEGGTPYSPEQDCCHQMQFNVLPTTPLFFGRA